MVYASNSAVRTENLIRPGVSPAPSRRASGVSVIVPTYNGARYIGDALRSLYAQTLLPDEIVVVDDCSTDGTLRVIEDLIPSSPVAVRTIRLKQNSGGPSHPINVGIAEATSDYIQVLDQDDTLHPEKLARSVALLRGNDAVSVVFSWCGVWGGEEHQTHQSEELKAAILAASRRGDGGLLISGRDALNLLVRRNNFVLGYPGMTFRRRSWLEKRGVDESYLIAGDMDFLAWLFRSGHAGIIPTIGYYRRLHDGNVTRRYIETRCESSRICCGLVAGEPDLRADADLLSLVRRESAEFQFWLRETGHYGQSVRVCGRLLRLGEPAARVAKNVAGIAVHAVMSKVFRRPLSPWIP